MYVGGGVSNSSLNNCSSLPVFVHLFSMAMVIFLILLEFGIVNFHHIQHHPKLFSDLPPLLPMQCLCLFCLPHQNGHGSLHFPKANHRAVGKSDAAGQAWCGRQA